MYIVLCYYNWLWTYTMLNLKLGGWIFLVHIIYKIKIIINLRITKNIEKWDLIPLGMHQIVPSA